jgi:hypothetical protein
MPSARSIAFSAAAAAADLLGSCPILTAPATDADPFQTPRSTSSTKAYSMSRYRVIIANAKYDRTFPG